MPTPWPKPGTELGSTQELLSEKLEDFQDRITEIEDQVADRRELFNASVTIYNTRLDQFPDVIIARLFNFTGRQLWKIDPAHRQDVEVSFQHT